jgi:hypothetical protein
MQALISLKIHCGVPVEAKIHSLIFSFSAVAKYSSTISFELTFYAAFSAIKKPLRNPGSDFCFST